MMMNEAIINKWIEGRSDVALKKLLNNEPLSFEDNIVFALVGSREETKRLEKRMEERFEQVDKCFEQIDKCFDRLEKEVSDMRREMMLTHQDINTLTRWILVAILAVPALMKLLDILAARWK